MRPTTESLARPERSLRPSALRASCPAPPGLLDLVRDYWLQQRTERRLRARGADYRRTDPDAVARAYDAMSPGEFRAINGPQHWVNRRVVPRVVAAAPRGRAWLAVDLGCGSGDSTALLAAVAPPGSRCLGVDLSSTLLEVARRQRYVGADGRRAQVDFVCQRIDEPLRDPRGRTVDDGTVDVVHSAGVVGHHLDAEGLHALAGELDRVLCRDGIAALDHGPRIRRGTLVRTLAEHGFTVRDRLRYAWFGSRGVVVFGRGPA